MASDVPMLDNAWWAQVAPLLARTIHKIKAYRERTGASVIEAKSQNCGEKLVRSITISRVCWKRTKMRFGIIAWRYLVRRVRIAGNY
jgi:hypothetical protein